MALRAYGRNGGYVLHEADVRPSNDGIVIDFRGKKGIANAWIHGTHEEVIDLLEVLLQQAMDTFTEPYGGVWGEHPDWSPSDWASEALDDNTRLGYWAWVRNQIRLVEEGAIDLPKGEEDEG